MSRYCFMCNNDNSDLMTVVDLKDNEVWQIPIGDALHCMDFLTKGSEYKNALNCVNDNIEILSTSEHSAVIGVNTGSELDYTKVAPVDKKYLTVSGYIYKIKPSPAQRALTFLTTSKSVLDLTEHVVDLEKLTVNAHNGKIMFPEEPYLTVNELRVTTDDSMKEVAVANYTGTLKEVGMLHVDANVEYFNTIVKSIRKIQKLGGIHFQTNGSKKESATLKIPKHLEKKSIICNIEVKTPHLKLTVDMQNQTLDGVMHVKFNELCKNPNKIEVYIKKVNCSTVNEFMKFIDEQVEMYVTYPLIFNGTIYLNVYVEIPYNIIDDIDTMNMECKGRYVCIKNEELQGRH